jgi:hypothetical protein
MNPIWEHRAPGRFDAIPRRRRCITQIARQVVAAFMLCCLFTTAIAAPAEKKSTTRLIVLDPLSKELACACVKGYGQRDYRKLASRL